MPLHRTLKFKIWPKYTAQTGLPYFDRAAVKTNGNWYYGKALEPMRGKLYFSCRGVNTGPIYKQ